MQRPGLNKHSSTKVVCRHANQQNTHTEKTLLCTVDFRFLRMNHCCKQDASRGCLAGCVRCYCCCCCRYQSLLTSSLLHSVSVTIFSLLKLNNYPLIDLCKTSQYEIDRHFCLTIHYFNNDSPC